MSEKLLFGIELYTPIQTLTDVQDEFSDIIIPSGSQGTIVDYYQKPEEAYAVDLAIPDPEQITGFKYYHATLKPNQFKIFYPN